MTTDTLPATPGEYFDRYPASLWGLCAVLKPLKGIMQHIQAREGCDYETACRSLVAEHFVAVYERYVQSYDATRCSDFVRYCQIQFVYRVRRSSEYSQRKENYRRERGLPVTQTIDDIDRLEGQDSLQTPGCQLCRLIGQETERDAQNESGAVFSELRNMEALESWIVWNHGALGHSYDAIAQAQGISATTAKKIYLGAMARLRRVVGVG